MTCGHCTRAITQAIVDLDQQAHVVTDLVNKTVQVNSTLSHEQISHAITEAGYTVVAVA